MSKIKVETIGTLFGVIGAILVAFNIGYNKLGYFFFLISSVCYIFFGLRINSKEMVTLNATFSIINIIGLFRY